MRLTISAVLLAASWAGCSTLRGPHQTYDSPRVIGRVLDAQTLQPVARALVRRGHPGESATQRRLSDRKGAEELLEPTGAETDADGWFRLTSQKSFYVLTVRGRTLSARLVVEHPDYRTLATNVTGGVTGEATPAREPVADAGNLFLQPKTRQQPAR
jgi:hypothetical protein